LTKKRTRVFLMRRNLLQAEFVGFLRKEGEQNWFIGGTRPQSSGREKGDRLQEWVTLSAMFGFPWCLKILLTPKTERN